MALRTFLFDLGNVLVYFSHERMYAQIAELCRTSPQAVETFLADTGLIADYDIGVADDTRFHQRLEDWSGVKINPQSLAHAGGDIFQLNEPMLPLLTLLRARDYRLVLLSNTCPSHIASVRRQWPSLLEHFDQLVLSYEVGAMKPDLRIYDAALRAIGAAPRECFYTDDIKPFVAQGKALGLDAEVFTGYDNLLAQLRQRGIDL